MPNWFPTLTLDGFECVLLLPRIAWNKRPRIVPAIGGENAEGRTGIEANATEHDEERLSIEFQYILATEQCDQFLAVIRDLGPEQRLLVPLWPDVLPAADYPDEAVFLGEHWLNVDADTGAYAIDENAGHPESVGLAMCAPTDLPKRKPHSDLEAELTLAAEEDSPWEARVQVNDLVQAAWTWEPDYAAALEDSSRWQLQRRRMGHGRVTARTGTGAPVKRVQAAPFTFTSRAELRRALTFWTSKLGPRDPFTVPLFLRPAWDGTPGDEPVMQARFADESFPIEFAPPDTAYEVSARTRLSFTQQLLLGGGAPSQSVPARPLLVKVWWEGSATVYAWTDWMRDYVHAGVTYQPRPIELKSLHETLRLGQSEWELLVTDFDGNPLRSFGRFSLERRLRVEVREFNPAIANAAALVFTGDIRRSPNKGPIYTATLSRFGRTLRYLIPGCTSRTTCNNTFGDALCGKNLEELKATGTIAAIAGTLVDVTTSDAGAAEAWALGYVLIGAGDTQEVRSIVRSTPIAGGQHLTLNRPLWAAEAGNDVVIYPGCDQQYYGGCARWANQGAFFGAPHKPEFIASVDSGYRAKTGK